MELTTAIKSLNKSELVENQILLNKLYNLIKPSYKEPNVLSESEINLNTKIYLAEQDDELLAFFMVGWQQINIEGINFKTVYLGLSRANQQTKNTGLIRLLYKKFVEDAKAQEGENAKNLWLWFTTASVIIYSIANFLGQALQPTMDGSYTEEGEIVAQAIRRYMGWTNIATHHPFVLPGIYPDTQYSEEERQRLAYVAKEKNFTLFDKLGVDERKGDRLLCICRLP